MGERGAGSTTSLYQGRDAYSTQRDAWSQRARDRPRADVWFCSTMHSPIWNGNSAAAGAAKAATWYLLPLCPFPGDMQIHEMRLRVTTAAGGADVDVALFVYIVDDASGHADGHLHLVPGTYSHFHAGAVGVKSVKFPHLTDTNGNLQPHPIVRPENHYFIGYASSSVTTKFHALSMGGGLAPVVGMREYPYRHGPVHTIHFEDTTESTADTFPFVVFLSETASGIF